MQRPRRRSGFTIIEMLVVIGITGLLSAYLVVYSNTSREQLSIAIEASRLAQVIARAKALAISTYGASTALCGYGIHMDYSAQQYSLINFDAPNCGGLTALPTASTTARYPLPPEVVITTGANSITDIYFLPPDPKTYLNIGGVLVQNRTGSIYLQTRGGSAERSVKVSPGGQITF